MPALLGHSFACVAVSDQLSQVDSSSSHTLILRQALDLITAGSALDRIRISTYIINFNGNFSFKYYLACHRRVFCGVELSNSDFTPKGSCYLLPRRCHLCAMSAPFFFQNKLNILTFWVDESKQNIRGCIYQGA